MCVRCQLPIWAGATLTEAVCGSKVLIQLSKELGKQQAQGFLVAAVKWELSGPQFLTNWT